MPTLEDPVVLTERDKRERKLMRTAARAMGVPMKKEELEWNLFIIRKIQAFHSWEGPPL